MLKTRISQSKKFSQLTSDKTRLLYLMMLPHLDIEGRLDADPKIIKGIVTPLLKFSSKTILASLVDLHEVGLICLYGNENDTYLEYYRFADFQNLRTDREAASEIPSPSSCPADSRSTPPQVKLSEVKLSEVKGKGKKFIPPTLQEVTEYIKSKEYTVEPKVFFDYFNESGWIDSRGNKVKNWKQKIITWNSRNGKRQPESNQLPLL